jgi:putative tryptophan/tyrosine transport system substrate-binding protein
MTVTIGRRELLATLGGAAATWPLAARAQQPERVRRIGVLIGLAETDTEVGKYLSELRKTLRALGWIEGKNLWIDHRAAADLDGMRSHALDLVNLGAELVVTYATPATDAVRQAAGGLPIVFTSVSDPIGTGFVESFSRPGGMITGFTNFEASMGSKWLELMHDLAPSVNRAAMLFNPTTANAGASGGIYLPSMKAAAEVLGVQLTDSAVNDPAEIDGLFASLAQGPQAGVIVVPNVFTFTYRQRIVAQAARFRIPTVYPYSEFVRIGGLLSYSIDYLDLFRHAASYADRILRGTKPADLPVQQPTKFELIINLKTAKSLELSIPQRLLVAADEVIE